MIRRFVRLSNAISLVLAYIAALAIAGLAILIAVNVVRRGLGMRSVPGLVEVSETLMVGVVFLAMAYAEKSETHVRMELATSRASAKATTRMRVVAMLVSFGITAAFAYYSGAGAWRSFFGGETRFGIITFPVWPARALIFVGFLLTALQYLVKLLGYLATLLPGYEVPPELELASERVRPEERTI